MAGGRFKSLTKSSPPLEKHSMAYLAIARERNMSPASQRCKSDSIPPIFGSLLQNYLWSVPEIARAPTNPLPWDARLPKRQRDASVYLFKVVFLAIKDFVDLSIFCTWHIRTRLSLHSDWETTEIDLFQYSTHRSVIPLFDIILKWISHKTCCTRYFRFSKFQ